MDLETRTISESFGQGSKLEVYHISIYDGKNFLTFYLSDYTNSEELITNSILSLMLRKYHGYKIYIHNLSNFDGIFLLTVLTKIGIVNPIINKGKIISISLTTFNNSKDGYVIHFRDSYQLLLSSLKSGSLDIDL